MQDLFSSQEAALSPLADRMRPRTLDEFIGQGHIVGPGRLLRRAIEDIYYFDTTIKSSEIVEDKLGLTVIGIVPKEEKE